jgi:Zn-dependent protease
MASPRPPAGLLPGTVRIGRLAGVPIAVHFSWLVVAAMIALSLAAHFERGYATWSPTTIWTTAIVTSALFFIILVAHELSHAIMAKTRGMPVRSITLFPWRRCARRATSQHGID